MTTIFQAQTIQKHTQSHTTTHIHNQITLSFLHPPHVLGLFPHFFLSYPFLVMFVSFLIQIPFSFFIMTKGLLHELAPAGVHGYGALLS